MERKLQARYHQRTANSCKLCCLGNTVNHKTSYIVSSSVSHRHKTLLYTHWYRSQPVTLDFIYSHFKLSQKNRAAGTEQDKLYRTRRVSFLDIQLRSEMFYQKQNTFLSGSKDCEIKMYLMLFIRVPIKS